MGSSRTHSHPAWDRLAPTHSDLMDPMQRPHPMVAGFSLFGRHNPWRRVPGLHRSKSVRSEGSTGDTETGLLEPLVNSETRKRKRSIFGLPLIHPSSTICLVQLIVMGFVDATYTAIKVPITFATMRDLTVWSISSILDTVAGAIFTLDMFLRFHVATPAVATNTRKVVMPDGYQVAKSYMLQGSFAIDLLATLPSWIEVLVDQLHEELRISLGFLNVLRLLRLLRLGRFIQGVFVLSLGGQVGRKMMGILPVSYLYVLNIMYAMLVLINLLGCAWLFTAHMEGAEHSWLVNVDGTDLSDAPMVNRYVAAIHFATTTMATVGYGDVSPHNNTERIVAISLMAVGVVFFGFMINALGELLQHAGTTARRATLLHNKIQDVESWMTARHLPRKIRTEVTAYYADAWVSAAEVHEAELLAELPRHLKGKIILHLLADIFDHSELFARLDQSTRSLLSAALIPRALLPGHDLCHPGDPARCLWLLQKGVIVAVQQGENVDVLYAPALLGEASLLTEQHPECTRRSCGFRAQESCMVWELSMDELHNLVFDHPHLKQQLQQGFHDALKRRMQNNPRARWKSAMSKIRTLLHAKPDRPHAHSGSTSMDALYAEIPDSPSQADSMRSPFLSEQTGSPQQSGLAERVMHSMDVMYNAASAAAVTAYIASLLRGEGTQPGEGNRSAGDLQRQEDAEQSPFRRSTSRVTFDDQNTMDESSSAG